jgi:hypothetical protein
VLELALDVTCAHERTQHVPIELLSHRNTGLSSAG